MIMKIAEVVVGRMGTLSMLLLLLLINCGPSNPKKVSIFEISHDNGKKVWIRANYCRKATYPNRGCECELDFLTVASFDACEYFIETPEVPR